LILKSRTANLSSKCALRDQGRELHICKTMQSSASMTSLTGADKHASTGSNAVAAATPDDDDDDDNDRFR
jgi:hypothetical protein